MSLKAFSTAPQCSARHRSGTRLEISTLLLSRMIRWQLVGLRDRFERDTPAGRIEPNPVSYITGQDCYRVSTQIKTSNIETVQADSIRPEAGHLRASLINVEACKRRNAAVYFIRRNCFRRKYLEFVLHLFFRFSFKFYFSSYIMRG